MAITDVRILRSLKLTERKGEKQSVQLSATQDLLFLSDTADPSFAEILADTSTWANIGGTVPQLNDETTVNGFSLYVSSRDLSYYDDNERAVRMTIRYDAKDIPDEGGGDEPPSGTDPEAWKRITVTTEQKTKPALGWPSFDDIPGEDEEVFTEAGAQNSAGDPVDGLEEQSSMIKMTYTNTEVLNPKFEELNRYLNTCNDAEFLGAKRYCCRMVGWNAEYDQVNNLWSVSVEFLVDPDDWSIGYFDVGFNEIKNDQRVAILDIRGNPVSKPVPLDGTGEAVAIDTGGEGYGGPVEPVTLWLYPYRKADFSNLFANCGLF